MIEARGAGGRKRLRLHGALLCLFLASNLVLAAAPARIVSLNLCTDSMLLELMPMPHGVSLTHLALDPALSPLAARAAQVSINHGLAEEVVAFAPDLILSGASTPHTTAALLTRLGYRVEYFPTAHSLAAFMQAFRRLGQLLERNADIEARLAGMLRSLHATRSPDRGRESALLISGNGYVPGPETLADDLIAAVGLRNAAKDYGLPGGGVLSLERLVQHPPQWLLLGTVGSGAPALASEFLRHPVLRRVVADDRHLIAVPESWWACGGTYFAEAAGAIARNLQRVRETNLK